MVTVGLCCVGAKWWDYMDKHRELLMSDLLRKYQAIKDRVEAAQRESDRAAGALDQLLERLWDEFSCKTIKDGEKLLASLERKASEGEEGLAREISRFNQEWLEKFPEGSV